LVPWLLSGLSLAPAGTATIAAIIAAIHAVTNIRAKRLELNKFAS
jgi:hypothetical protein